MLRRLGLLEHGACGVRDIAREHGIDMRVMMSDLESLRPLARALRTTVIVPDELVNLFD